MLLFIYYRVFYFIFSLGIRDDNKDSDVTSRTLMIAGIPDTYCTKEFVHRHISEAYNDDAVVEEVQVAYDVSKLSWLDQKRDNAAKAR